jgi:MgtE intracellular N domain/CBS domain
MARLFHRLARRPTRSHTEPPDAGGGSPTRPAATERHGRRLPTAPYRHLLGARSHRALTNRAVRESIVSLAGVIGRPVRNPRGAEIGRLVDVICRWTGDETYPPVTGLVVRVGRRLAFVSATVVEAIDHTAVGLSSARLDLVDFKPRPGEVKLAEQVLDHQLVDIDGVKVIRAADLYLARIYGRFRLVGVDVSAQSLLRRLGPARFQHKPTPERVIDWAAIQPFGETEEGVAPEVRLRTTNQRLERLRPGELADLLEDLMRPERQKLLDSLSPKEAADALEEMDPEELVSLIREAEPARAAVLLAEMEPDEATDALRDLTSEERHEILEVMEPAKAAELTRLLGYSEHEAGGFMTTAIVRATMAETVGQLVTRLTEEDNCPDELDAVAVIDDEGGLVWDLPLLQLLVNPPDLPLGELVGEAEPVTVGIHAGVGEVAERLIDTRRLSILVVDEGRPVGRIMADDVIDVLVPERGRLHFPRLLQ